MVMTSWMASKSQLSCELDFLVQPALGWAHIAGAPLNKFGGQRFEREGNGGWRMMEEGRVFIFFRNVRSPASSASSFFSRKVRSPKTG